MDATHTALSTRIKVGVFTFVGLLLVVAVTVIVNNRPYWWRPCQYVEIRVEDATGLKSKSPIRSLGIEIGYLRSVRLTETYVLLGICVTAPVEVLPGTRAYIRGEGFLGDKFVELKPVKYVGPLPAETEQPKPNHTLNRFLEYLSIPQAMAETPRRERQIPVESQGEDVQHLVNRVDTLVNEISGLTNNLKQAINPDDLKRTMKQLNQTLENASRTLSPEGGLNTTAQRTLATLEDAIEQLRDQITRINQGQGSLGKLLNDPVYADELRLAIQNVNLLLNRVAKVRFIVDLGAVQVTRYDGARAWFHVAVWPRPNRYYLIGIAMDPRGRITTSTVATDTGAISQSSRFTVTEQTGILFTAMLGKIFWDRIDASIGALYGDGAASLAFRLGPEGAEERIQLRNDFYVRNAASAFDSRLSVLFFPFPNAYVRASLESFRTTPTGGQFPFSFGGGISFDDEDIKLLFALK